TRHDPATRGAPPQGKALEGGYVSLAEVVRGCCHFLQQVVDPPAFRCDFIEGKVDPEFSPSLRLARSWGFCRLALERQAVDAFRSGMVGMLFQPGSQLREAGNIGGGMHVALMLDMPQKDRVGQPRDELVCLFPAAFFLQCENAAIEGDV